ncbi:hypothetical protein J5N97_015112 [Dioscorea zingiberensis]|uniref:Uncharacterized protein n=1 Tax=Dioscorea zingiberensis TaxID=325984 RepID=A0A9D5HKD8_9LILI|nr:hypothetical protein J5N97_015112 [Dioscorea zingiberensis]
MAPSRKRGSARAAAAAAARQQWKVGDLVLAKMKGFPAWPAVISDPAKWGYSSDRKKLLVFFYGTKQIAFCNHADIEAFTEEKKKSLLSKRQGKGADFVRAVDEIIDIYEKLKKNDQSENNTEDEGVLPDNGNLEDSRSKTCGKATELSSHMNCDSQSEPLYASVDNSTIGSPDSVPVSSEKADFCKMNKAAKEPNEKISILDQLRQTPLAISTTVRKRPRDVALQSCTTQRKVPSLHRSRSSCVDPYKCQTSTSQQSTGNCDSGDDLIADAVPVELVNRKILVQDLSPSDGLNQLGSTDSVLNGICRESEYNIVSMESEAIDCEVETMSEPNCQYKHFGNGCSDNDDKVNPDVDTSIKTVILKKKRNPTRKRVHNDSEFALLDSNADLQIEEKRIVPESLNSCSEINERFHKTDGDEHLPLVKRARVRKGEPVAEDGQSGTFVLLNKSDENAISDSPSNNCPSDKSNMGNTEASECSLSIQNCVSNTRNDMKFWKAKYQLKNISIDVESALPPSKRLHRALEAMSANADELKVGHIDVPGTVELVSNGHMDSLETRPLHLNTDGDIGGSSESQNIHCPDDVASLHTLSEMSSDVVAKVLDTNLLISSSVNPDGIYSHNVTKEIDLVVEDRDDLHPRTKEGDIPEETLKPVSFCCEKQVPSTSNEVMVGELPPSVVVDMNSGMLQSLEDCRYAGVEKREGEDQILESIPKKLYSEAAVNVDPVNVTDVVLSINDGVLTSESANLPPYNMTLERDLQDPVTEITPSAISKDRGFSPDLAPIRVLIAAAQAKRVLSRSTSFTNSVEDGKAMLHSLVNYKEDSSDQGSPWIPLATHGPPFDDRTQASPNSSSPTLQQKGTDIPPEHAEAEATRKTFEASLYMLSRTKESIGRATQLAIECAKYGIAGEVIELLLRNLERESSLYRRVDLFFLVDSIVQCSRTQKGGAGDVYASLVQSVLSRLLSSAAPPGKAAWENRRQCLKVLRLWLERKILPESIVRHHIRELEFMNEVPFTTHSSRRPRTERGIDDPVLEMEGMLVDEYGSNTSFQLPGLTVPCVVEDDEHDCSSEEKSFEAVTPERNAEVDDGSGTVTSQEKHRHILEDVDGELEMEDVSPPCEVRVCAMSHVASTDNICNSDKQCDHRHSPTFVPPLPEDLPPSPPPLPSSPPPMPSPCSPPSVVNQHSSVGSSHVLTVAVDSSDYNPSHNIRSQLPQAIYQQPGNLSVNSVPSVPMPYSSHPYGDIRRQMPHPSHSLSSSSYGSFPGTHPTMHTANRVPPSVNRPIPNSYIPQPPPAIVSNQFSFVPAEPQQRVQAWGNCSSYPKTLQLVHDPRGGKFYSDSDMNGPIQHDTTERGRFSPTVHPGPMLSDKVDSSTIPPFYGPPSEPSPVPCRGWPFPPRISSYHPMSGTRPRAENSISPVEGVHSFWRPR